MRFRRTLFFLVAFPLALVPAELFIKEFKGVGPARRDTVEAAYMPIRLRGNYRGVVLDLPFETNRYGFRGEPDFPIQPEADEFRILFLGDSVGVGLGIPASDSYVKVAERTLSASAPDRRVRAINAAGQGYSPSSYLAYLKHEGLAFQPRAVVVQIELCNDVTDEALLSWSRDASGQLDAVRGGRYVVGWDGNLLGTVAVGPYFPEKTYLETLLLRRALNTLQEWFPGRALAGRPGVTYYHQGFDRFLLDEERIESGWRRLFAALSQTQRLLSERQIPLLVAIVPPRWVFEEKAGPAREFSQGLLDRAARMSDQAGLTRVEFQQELAQAGGAARYFDFAHPDALGNQVIGEKLAARLAIVARPSRP